MCLFAKAARKPFAVGIRRSCIIAIKAFVVHLFFKQMESGLPGPHWLKLCWTKASSSSSMMQFMLFSHLKPVETHFSPGITLTWFHFGHWAQPINSSGFLLLSHLPILIHLVMPFVAASASREHALELEDVKHVVHMLHTALHLPEHHLLNERQLLEKLDHLKQELSPLEKVEAMCKNLLSSYYYHTVSL